MNSGYFPRTAPPPPPGKEVRVVRHPRGWAVIRVGNMRPSRVTPDKERAILIAKGYAREERSSWVVEDDETADLAPVAPRRAAGEGLRAANCHAFALAVRDTWRKSAARGHGYEA